MFLLLKNYVMQNSWTLTYSKYARVPTLEFRPNFLRYLTSATLAKPPTRSKLLTNQRIALALTFCMGMFTSLGNQSIDLQYKSIDWFLWKGNIVIKNVNNSKARASNVRKTYARLRGYTKSNIKVVHKPDKVDKPEFNWFIRVLHLPTS